MFAQKSYLRQQYSFRTKYNIGQVTCKMFTLYLGQIYIVTKTASAIILSGMTGQKVNVTRHQIAQRKIGVWPFVSIRKRFFGTAEII